MDTLITILKKKRIIPGYNPTICSINKILIYLLGIDILTHLVALLLWVRFHRASNQITCNQLIAPRILATPASVFPMKFQVFMVIHIDQLLWYKPNSFYTSNNIQCIWVNSKHKRILLIAIMILVIIIITLTKQTIIITIILLLSLFHWFLQSILSSRVSSAISDFNIHLYKSKLSRNWAEGYNSIHSFYFK